MNREAMLPPFRTLVHREFYHGLLPSPSTKRAPDFMLNLHFARYTQTGGARSPGIFLTCSSYAGRLNRALRKSGVHKSHAHATEIQTAPRQPLDFPIKLGPNGPYEDGPAHALHHPNPHPPSPPRSVLNQATQGRRNSLRASVRCATSDHSGVYSPPEAL